MVPDPKGDNMHFYETDGQDWFLLEDFKKNLNASKPSEHPPQVEECLKV